MHETDTTSGADLFALQKPALIVGVIALVGLLIGAFLDTDQFFRSYLMGWLLIVMISAGALAVLMIQYLSGGRWGVIIRRPAEAIVSTIPLVGLAMIPVLVGMHSIYAWTHTDLVAHDALLQHKEAYLNVPFFIARAVLYFAIWSALALMLVRWGRSLDENHDGWVELRIRRVAAGGILALGLTLTFASVDWIMSLEPHWFSTMFGISFIIGMPSGRVDGDHSHGGPALPLAALPRRGAAPLFPGPRKPDARLHHALGLHLVLPVPPDLVRQHP
jgi:hypothetical protein